MHLETIDNKSNSITFDFKIVCLTLETSDFNVLKPSTPENFSRDVPSVNNCLIWT